MTKVRWIDFSGDEWLGGAQRLDNATRGLYITICALIYSHGGPVAWEDVKAQCGDHGLAMKRQLRTLLDLGKVTEENGRIDQERCENELRKARERMEKAQKNAGKRWKPNGLDETVAVLPSNATTTTTTTTPLKPPHGGASANGKSQARKRNGHDPYGHGAMTLAELSARFNDKTVPKAEHNALRERLFPGATAPV